MRARAVIWDLDGVIVDTGPCHLAAWRQLCRIHNRILDEQAFRRTFGQRNQEITRLLFGAALADSESKTLADEKEELFRAAVGNDVRALPGVISLISALNRAGYAQAIGSSAPSRNIDVLITTVGLRNSFQVIVGEEDVRMGKPDPEIFALAASRLGVPPTRCVVIEDAVAGVMAARAAGMACVAVTNTRDRAALEKADLVVDSLEEIAVVTVDGLIDRNDGGRPR